MPEYQITLTSRDGRQLNFNCAAGCDVVSAAEQVNIKLPSLCRDGGCGACLGHCDSGEYTLGQYSAGMLSTAAAAQGDVLLCKTYPQGDLQISAPYDYAHIQFGRQQARQAVITGLAQIAHRTVQLNLSWLDQQADKAVQFEPGQCMELEIPDTGIRRAYSLANTANWRGELEFLIRLQPEGQFSNYLRQQAAVGQVLNIYGPSGAFGLQPNNVNPAILIAGGTGLAPFLSMLRRLAEWGEDRPIQLLFGVNQENELFYQDELQRLQAKLPSLNITYCVWKPQQDWSGGFAGTPADALQLYLAKHPDQYDIYLCGPPLLVTAAVQIALAQGIAEERVFSEKFG